MHRRALSPSSIALTACCLSLGCNNPPGALKLRLVPERLEIRSGEPVRVVAVFSAEKGRICIDRPTKGRLKVELSNLDTGEDRTQSLPFICGVGLMAELPLEVAKFIGSGLDVCDLSGRYAVVSPGHEYHTTLDIVGAGYADFVLFESSEVDQDGVERDANWPPPGRYQLKMKFPSHRSSAYPRPLFWSLYDQPVEAAMALTVKKAANAS